MHALPTFFATLAAILIAPGLLRSLRESGHVRANYRGRQVAFPFGVLCVAAALIALIPLALLQQFKATRVLHPELLQVAVYVLGVALLGLIDDALGGEPRGWRGHGRAVLRLRFSTGALKALGAVGLALYVLSWREPEIGRWLLASAVLVLATNAFNLLDLRPGRATKAFTLLGVGLVFASGGIRALWTLGLFGGPVLVAGVYDLRERAMLGDTGSNLIGALAGLWLVLTLSTIGQAIAFGLLVLITIYGELRSISELIDGTPLVRELDSWGRPS